MAVSHAFSNAVADAVGTMTIWFGATTATVAATDVVLPSHWNSAHNNLVTLSGNTAGVSTLSGTNIVYAGSNNVTVSGVQGANAATVLFSAAAGGGGGSLNVSAGTTSNNLTALTFADSNGVSFGLNGSVVTATVQTNYLTTARASNDAIGLNSAVSNVTATINSSGLSFDARGYAGTGTTFNGANVSGSLTQNSNGLQVSLSVATALTSQSNQNITAGNGGFAFQTLSFSNVNGISFGTSAGSAITASHNAITTGRASNDGVGLNTAQTNVTWTVNSAGLSLNAAGYAGTGTTFNGANVSGSMTVNSVGVQLSMSVAAGGGGLTQGTFYAQSNTTQSSTGTIALSSLNFAGAGIASVGITNGSVVISVPAGGGAGDGGVFAGVSNLGNTAGSTGTVSTGNFVLVGSNGITLSQSTGAAGSAATITIDAGNPTFSFMPLKPMYANSVSGTQAMPQNSLYIWPCRVEDVCQGAAIFMPVNIVNSSLGSSSGQMGYTYQFAAYTRNATNATRLDSFYSTSITIAASMSSNVSRMVSYISGIGNSTSYNSASTSSAGLNLSTLFHGNRYLIGAFSTTLSRGDYWFALVRSSSSAGTSNSVLSIGHNIWRLADAGGAFPLGSASNNASITDLHAYWGQGVYSTSTGAIPASIGFNQVVLENNVYPVIHFATQTK